MILCVGEILADMIGTGVNSFDMKAGGAPFNVACGIHRLGGKSAFAGTVGDDSVGRFLKAFAAQNVDEPVISTDHGRNTTLAFVNLDENGERSFCFYRKDTADAYLPEVSDELLKKCSIVHFGSLGLGGKESFRRIVAIADRAKALGCKISLDVNYRGDIFDGYADGISNYKAIISRADLLKLSEDEVGLFGEEYLGGLKNTLVLITLGKEGSEWRYKGERGRAGSVKVKAVDTTGAGDAFYAAALKQLDGAEDLSADALGKILAYANVSGALTTTKVGAIDAVPTDADIRAMLAK